MFSRKSVLETSVDGLLRLRSTYVEEPDGEAVKKYDQDPQNYTLVMTNIAIENGPLCWIFPLKMEIFHSYVSLLEGIGF